MSNKTYTYGNTQWGDQLTGFNGTAITYDAIGNPLSYYNGNSYTFTWSGRQLTGAIKGDKTMSFTYNDEGIRTSKTVNGVTTTYYLKGSQIVAEETSGNLTVYLYDSEGLPIGMQYHGAAYGADVWDIYWFEKNIFGDIVSVYDNSGNLLLVYNYEAYGAWSINSHNDGIDSSAGKNPFRYRGYYYDSDLDMYYLNSRYYDPYTGRFISPDNIDVVGATPTALTDKNLYAYCDNNPVMRVDRSGESWLLSLAIGIVVNIVNSVISSAVVGEEYTLVNLAVDVASAAVNVIPSVGRWFSAAVSGIYTGYSTYQSGATLEGAIISGVIAGSLTAFSIGNLAEFDKSVFQIITNGVTDLVFGSGYAMISAAISKWQAIQGRSSPRRADTLKPTEN